MVFDYRRLRGKIKEMLGTQDETAKRIGISRTSLSQKLNNHQEFTQGEIRQLCSALRIDSAEITEYFFVQDVQKREQII